MISSG